MIRRLLALCVVLVGLSITASAFFAWRYQTPELPDAPAAVVVLSAGAVNGQMGPQTAQRTERGIAVWQSLPDDTLLIMSGGGDPQDNEPIKAELMAAAARAAGVPETVLRVEGASHSTLQNALFTSGLLGEQATAPVVFVTHRFHGLRSWASLRWAGFTDLTFVPTEPDGAPPVLDGLIMEGIKWPANVLRGGAYSVLTAFGIPQDELLVFLQ